jgi:hypothetical protein
MYAFDLESWTIEDARLRLTVFQKSAVPKWKKRLGAKTVRRHGTTFQIRDRDLRLLAPEGRRALKNLRRIGDNEI